MTPFTYFPPISSFSFTSALYGSPHTPHLPSTSELHWFCKDKYADMYICTQLYNLQLTLIEAKLVILCFHIFFSYLFLFFVFPHFFTFHFHVYVNDMYLIKSIHILFCSVLLITFIIFLIKCFIFQCQVHTIILHFGLFINILNNRIEIEL